MNKYEKALIESNKHLTRENQLIFNELVERATAEKVVNGKCPNCNDDFQFESAKFCDNCGQALDWSE